jgi:hypothetical protein
MLSSHSLKDSSRSEPIEKAKYCEAAFSYVTWWAETYDRRNEVGLGLTGPLDIAPILAEIETLVPVCGLPVN